MHSLFLLLSVVAEEVLQLHHSLVQNLDSGQVNDPEMVRLMPVEALTGDQQYLLIPQQIKSELLIVSDIESLGVNLGEDVEACLGLYSADTGDIIQCLGDEFSLFIYTAAGNNVILDALIATQCCLHNGLGRYIGTKTHIGEHIETFDVIPTQTHIAADDHPANTETGDHMRLGEAGEGDTEQIRS